MSCVKWLVSASLAGMVVVVSGCEKLENKPKDPLVEGEPSPFFGLQNGVDLNPEDALATYYLSSVSAGSKFAFQDYLSDEVDDNRPVIRSGQYRPDRDFGWLSERNRPLTHFGGYDVDGRNWYLVDSGAETLSFQLQGFDPNEAEKDTSDLATLDGEFNCLQYNIRPEPEVRFYDLSVAGGSAVLVDKTAGSVANPQNLTLTKGEWAKLTVTEGAQDITAVCAGKEPEGYEDAYFDFLKASYTNTSPYYDICWSVEGQGGFQLDGNALYFSYIAQVEPVRKRFFDANNDGKEDKSGADIPDNFVDVEPNDPSDPPGPDGLNDGAVPALPPDIRNLVTPNEDGLAGIGGFRPVRSVNYCLRKGDNLTNQDIEETFWVGQSLRDQGDSYVVFSGVGFDGAGLAAEEQIESSGPGNLRELAYDYHVESDGEIVINGARGMMSADGRLIIYDLTDTTVDRVGVAIGIKEARLQD